MIGLPAAIWKREPAYRRQVIRELRGLTRIKNKGKRFPECKLHQRESH